MSYIRKFKYEVDRTTSSYSHGMSYTRPYRIWTTMKRRCNSPRLPCYKNYGAKGVRVCARWKKFVNFWADMRSGYGRTLQIDRKKNHLPYCKSNCRWVTAKRNARNKRNTIWIQTPKGRMTMMDAAELYGFLPVTLRKRVEARWRPEDLLLPAGQQALYNRFSTRRKCV